MHECLLRLFIIVKKSEIFKMSNNGAWLNKIMEWPNGT